MDNKIDELTAKIKKLEDELITEFKKKSEKFYFKIENEKVKFEERVIKEGKSRITSSIKYLSSFPVTVILTIPFIWAMIIPVILADIMVTVFQAICFPIYKIPKVKRKDYVIIDRYNLFYLDRVEKINCLYCEYFNGVTAYVREIAARTEQFWCPIKHSKPLKDRHNRYDNFFDYGDYLTYKDELKKRRSDFKDLEETKPL
ncbi:hypothetical protein HUE87_06400 [Candidatus Sulfurimonas marisnigri]|uniref:Uncharacterized protein n=1 Tax=Candidatus Sulfurimonas marisnigri TaxID=2740405 RepID=A0A7S7M2I0_9BACT|nr:hypothetical protein HUE87_06400 [Candidatus Sulfurimonas marisnigri]